LRYLSGWFERFGAKIRERARSNVEGEAMLWLIWIALMLLTPVLAGIRVWLQLRAEAAQAASETAGEIQ
jgi:hypothetical protein